MADDEGRPTRMATRVQRGRSRTMLMRVLIMFVIMMVLGTRDRGDSQDEGSSREQNRQHLEIYSFHTGISRLDAASGNSYSYSPHRGPARTQVIGPVGDGE